MHIDERYARIRLPADLHPERSEHEMRTSFTVSNLVGYFSSWSAYQQYLRATGDDRLLDGVQQECASGAKHALHTGAANVRPEEDCRHSLHNTSPSMRYSRYGWKSAKCRQAPTPAPIACRAALLSPILDHDDVVAKVGLHRRVRVHRLVDGTHGQPKGGLLERRHLLRPARARSVIARTVAATSPATHHRSARHPAQVATRARLVLAVLAGHLCGRRATR